jgi:mono/diheme cytochrome c family protein
MYSRLVVLVTIAALGAMLAAGCSKAADSSSSTDSSAAASAAPAAAASADAPAAAASADAPAAAMNAPAQMVAAAGDVAKGEAIFAANCAACHGEKGAGGGVGPALKGEKNRKGTAAAVAWIKNPQPPMPKLYPAPLSEKDVADVAAYVESL